MSFATVIMSKRTSRVKGNFAAARVKRALKSNSNLRISSDAVRAADKLIDKCLVDLGKECKKLVHLTKRKTLTTDVLDAAKESKGLKLIAVDGRDILSASRVITCFRKGYGKDIRITANAKEEIVRCAGRFAFTLGDKSRSYTNNRKQATVQSVDVIAGSRCMM